MTTTVTEVLDYIADLAPWREVRPKASAIQLRELFAGWSDSRCIDGDDLWEVYAAIDHGNTPTTYNDLDEIAAQIGVRETEDMKEIYTMLMDIEGLGWLIQYDEHHEVEAALRTLVSLCAEIFATAARMSDDLRIRAHSDRNSDHHNRVACASAIRCHSTDVINDVYSRMDADLSMVISTMVQISGYEPDLCGYCGDGYCQYCSDTDPDDAINEFAEQCYQWWSERNPRDVPRLEWLRSGWCQAKVFRVHVDSCSFDVTSADIKKNATDPTLVDWSILARVGDVLSGDPNRPNVERIR